MMVRTLPSFNWHFCQGEAGSKPTIGKGHFPLPGSAAGFVSKLTDCAHSQALITRFLSAMWLYLVFGSSLVLVFGLSLGVKAAGRHPTPIQAYYQSNTASKVG
jgi:hypothetical protein